MRLLILLLAAVTAARATAPDRILETDHRLGEGRNEARAVVPVKLDAPTPAPPKRLESWQGMSGAITKVNLLGEPQDLAAFFDARANGEQLWSALQRELLVAESAEDVRAVAVAYTKSLIQRGYLLAWIAPEGQVHGGVLTMRVNMGRIGEVKFADSANLRFEKPGRVRERLGVASGEVFDYSKIRSQVEAVNGETAATIDLHVRGRSLADHTRVADLDVGVRDRLPITGRIFADTLRIDGAETGRYEAEIGIKNLTNRFDSLHLGAYAGHDASEYHAVSGAYVLPFGVDRLWRLRLTVGYADSEFIDFLPELDFGADETYAGIELIRRLPDFGNWRSDLALRARYRDYQDNLDLAGVAFSNPERSDTTLRLGWRGESIKADDWRGRNSFGAYLSVIPDSWVDNSIMSTFTTPGDSGGYTYVQLVAKRQQQLAKRLFVELRGEMQLSSDDVVDRDGFDLGGPHSIRGTTLAEAIGDEGYVLQATLLGTLPAIPGVPGIIQLGPFFDYGETRQQTALPGEEETARLSSVGLELRASLFDRLHIRSFVAWPQEDDGDSQDATGYLSGELLF